MTYLKIIDLKPVPGSLIDDFKCSGSAALLMKVVCYFLIITAVGDDTV
jgi:hypothetical protein